MRAVPALTRLQLTASRSMSFTATTSSKGLHRAFQTCGVGDEVTTQTWLEGAGAGATSLPASTWLHSLTVALTPRPHSSRSS